MGIIQGMCLSVAYCYTHKIATAMEQVVGAQISPSGAARNLLDT